jgi:hypothetical protein
MQSKDCNVRKWNTKVKEKLKTRSKRNLKVKVKR